MDLRPETEDVLTSRGALQQADQHTVWSLRRGLHACLLWAQVQMQLPTREGGRAMAGESRRVGSSSQHQQQQEILSLDVPNGTRQRVG